ncbi:tRNA (adenosine(37)-N6)-dimethylallyltransferase MiaA [Candidatus Nomurabacteria bacterium CG1_02_43_90]|uniref:tRNA dimethylallyltransferase n=1 Tax=Candidatus Nomurabacteria bacterium CG1_02_43_90 TaxID=1805281 RepID=A0A1J4V5L9_9BACT|nr:MAG: tRNA (adenosine(37)-N6)-dimethylallyltransferase MiaA [Candidatus Nomurabacteria bacterium CG1_02_43_90]
MTNTSMQKIIAIVGPTASGKSDLAVAVARQVNGEIISTDSRQIYRGLDLGTGKITKKEMCGIPHHLLDIASPKRQISVVGYEKLATRAVRDIIKRGKVPILCGGTGLYTDAILNNLSFPTAKPNKALRQTLAKYSPKELFEQLKKLDPIRAETIEPTNPHRLIRAIEIATELGSVPPLVAPTPRYHALIIGIAVSREKLAERIELRLHSRMRKGMLAEIRHLHKEGLSWKRMEELGLEYRFLAQFLQKKITRDEMLRDLATAIRHYAKRQMVWFKRNKAIKWFPFEEQAKIMKEVRAFLE